MAEFKISRFRYTWKGAWESSTEYIKDDVVSYGGSSWVCIRMHTATAFLNDQNFLENESDTDYSPAWTKMADGYAWKGVWAPTTVYAEGDIVRNGGRLYICVNDHVSEQYIDSSLVNWAEFSKTTNFIGSWDISTRYSIGDIVSYNGYIYSCIQGHTSANLTGGLESNQSSWVEFFNGIEYLGQWQPDYRYRLNDLVKYGGSIYRCISPHTSGDDSTLNFDSESLWQMEFAGQQYQGLWNAITAYAIGDIVRHGGYLYICLKDSFGDVPSAILYQAPEELFWAVMMKGIEFKGEWSVTTSYKTGDVVRRGGRLYVALLDTSQTTVDGSTLDYLDESNWELITEGYNWRSFWNETRTYVIGDVVAFLGKTYRCTVSHLSDDQNYPGDNGSGFDYWELLIDSATEAGMRLTGDLLTYNLSRRLAGDGSTIGPTNVEIGVQGQIVTINKEDTVIYKDYEHSARFFYVSLTGTDNEDLGRGLDPDRPWRTVRFACERADDGYQGFTTIFVGPGEFEEILPIIVPAKTVILGTELRTTTITAKPANSALSGDSTYSISALARIDSLIPNILRGLPVTKTPSNRLDQTILTTEVVETVLEETITTIIPIPVDNQAIADVRTLITQLISYINFYVNSTGNTPAIVGSNTAETDTGYTNAVLMLEANKLFLAEEAVAAVKQNFPTYNFDEEQCKRDVRSYIDAFKYDIIYTGNYKTLLAGRYYRNAVLGSLLEDMFYLRDATGVRNCTLKGLRGELNPALAFDLYQLPTGGAYCSLDPGWGPNDDRTWIITRSPYVQGVTTFGTACIGQKIDGALHNGGNKSIVSNDFTQVLSDGIGAWVANLGRAELVSVFTYYCHIGYLTTEGGIIRATNGNNSYGTYGAIADGTDPSEIPEIGTVNGRNQDAIVSAAFAGEFTDEIQIIEWANAGERYTQASATFVGAGAGASVIFEDFRDDAVFQALVIDQTPEADRQTLGGGGYVLVQNNAQPHGTPGGDLYSITLSAADSNEEANYLGMRLIITGGTGTGQYGYITGYNSSTKVAVMARETDGQPGWDNVIPGRPNEPVFDTTTAYRIEPRVIFSDPGININTIQGASSSDWVNSVYGEIQGSWSAIEAADGTGTTDGISPAPATFNVSQSGRTYTVTLNDGGAGYQVGEIITLAGTEFDGLTPDHDIVITVTETTDDSTNEITAFEYEGIAPSGRFVVVTRGGSAVQHSTDGSTWAASTMPSSGDWLGVAAGNNMFVAVKHNSTDAAYSLNGIDWTTTTLPSSSNWVSVVYAYGKFVAIASDTNSGAYSTDGINWTGMSLPSLGDSTFNEWVDVTAGKGKFVAVANSGNFTAYSTDGINWAGTVMDSVDDSSQRDWKSITYGNNRFVAISTQGDISYSFDGITWLGASMPSQDGSTPHFWYQIRYGQGIFLAVGDTGGRTINDDVTEGPSTFAASSVDGVNWTPRTLTLAFNWRTVAFGNPYISNLDSSTGKNTPIWIAVARNTNRLNKLRIGCRPIGRIISSAGQINSVKLWDPGSGYVEAPTITVIDPNNTSDAKFDARLGDGVLANPSWVNRGLGYRTTTTRVTVTGNGYADVIATGAFVTVSNIDIYPGPGAQIYFAGNSTRYSIAAIEELGAINGGLTARFKISPYLEIRDRIEHGVSATIIQRYSQNRITGHDFLDIGTGNFEETNYPELYATGLYVPAPENEIYEESGGRVFYTATDQSGNFRTGELFAVEQATGIVTISAEFFDLSGLTELRLGGIRIGGTGAVIREFSTDPLFTEDSNNIVPTQRAISRYLQNRLTVGGSEIATASFIAGLVRVGPDLISNTIGTKIVVPVRADFNKQYSGIRGMMLAQKLFLGAR